MGESVSLIKQWGEVNEIRKEKSFVTDLVQGMLKLT